MSFLDQSFDEASEPITKIISKDVDKNGPVFPNKVNNKCPAIIFAANRTANVLDRIKFLIVSIHTIKGFGIGGVS